MRREAIVAAIGVLVLSLGIGVGQADHHADAEEKKDVPDATLQLEGGSVAVGVGFSWGSGTLTYQGKEYPFSVSGLSVGAVGATKVTARGNVFNLKKLEDFDGNYTGTAAGGAAGGGAGVVALRNQNGVGIEILTTTKGAALVAATGGVTMKRTPTTD